MEKFFLVISCILLTGLAIPELSHNFSPARNYSLPAAEVEAIGERYDSMKAIYKSLPGKQYDIVSKSFKEMKHDISKLDSLNLLMKNDEITRYLNGLKDRIIKANKNTIKRDFTIYTERSLVPNAYNYGAHIVIVELGFVCSIQTEDELIYVLCHEISHDLLSHVDKGIKKRAELLTDKELKTEIRKLNNQEYGRYKQSKTVLKSFLSKYMTHSRENELEADSLGFILYKNMSLPQVHCVDLLELLDVIDEPFYTTPVDYHKHFDFGGVFKLDESLFADEDYTDLGGNIDSVELTPDSLKTHPESKERAQKIKKLVNNTTPVKTDNNAFERIRELAKFEEVEYLLNYRQYGLALYYCLHLSKSYPDNLYLKNSILYCLSGLHAALVNHTYSYFTDLPDKHYPGEYNKYLIFINNLNENRLKSMIMNYSGTMNFDADKSAYARFVGICMEKSLDKTIDEQVLISDYEKQYKDSYYINVLKEKYPNNNNKKNKK